MILMMASFNLPDNLYFLVTSISLCIIPIYLLLNQNKHRFIILLLVLSVANVVDEICGLAIIRNILEYVFAITAFILIVCRKKI